MCADASIALTGCGTDTMARYLKSLGAFGVLARSTAAPVRASWADSRMVIHMGAETEAALTKDGVAGLVYREYEPTPIVTPWNGGGGFVEGGGAPNKTLERVEASAHPRFAAYARTVGETRKILSRLRHKGGAITNKDGEIRADVKKLPPKEWNGIKTDILKACRNCLPDEAVSALDAMYALPASKPGYNPLLGSGGNDGRLEFIDNFRQNLLAAFADGGEDASKKWLHGSLFGGSSEMINSAIGQFDPGSMFGPNMTTVDDDGTSLINPWDYILMIEGAILFAGGVTRHLALESRARASFPFVVESSNAGYGTAGGDEETRGEVWAPIWDSPATLAEIRHVFGEARVQLGARRATRGSDVARAIVTLGTQLGLSYFYRFGILERNGRSNIVLPMGRIAASRQPRGAVLAELDRWLDKARRAKNPPASVRRHLRAVEDSIFRMAESGDDRPDAMQRILIAVGDLELALARSYSGSNDYSNPFPLQRLTSTWVDICYDGTAEFRLAASLASIAASPSSIAAQGAAVGRIRTNIEPVVYDGKGNVRWLPGSVSVVPHGAPFGRYVTSILQRRMIDAARANDRHAPTRGTIPAPLPDIVQLLCGRLDLGKILALLVPLSLVEPRKGHTLWEASVWERDAAVPYSFAALKMLFLEKDFGETRIRYETSVATLLAAGRLGDALDVAQRRLFASGVGNAARAGDGRRAAAGVPLGVAQNLAPAMLFPVGDYASELYRVIQRGSDGVYEDA